MEENSENMQNEGTKPDFVIQSEEIAFKPEQLIICEKCQRKNPPNRLNCLYCAAQLDVIKENLDFIKPNLRKPEDWEKGFNVVLNFDESNFEQANVAEIFKSSQLEREDFEKILQTKKNLPIARVESESEAVIIAQNLTKKGISSKILPDEKIAQDILPIRLRGLKFLDDKLILNVFNSGETVEINRENLILIVTGAVFENKTEAVEKRKKGETKVLESYQTSSDEFLIDIYDNKDAIGYRIWAKGFDFSCLEFEKGLLANENIKKLLGKLAEFAPNAKLVDDYLIVRNLLGKVWEIEQKRESNGFKRFGFGKLELANVSLSSNLQQFTKYSRLQWHIL